MRYTLFLYKPVALFLLSLLCQLSSLAQLQEMETSKAEWITVGEVKWLSNTKASLKYLDAGGDKTYLLYLQDDEKLKNNRDMTVYQYFSIRFSGKDNTIEKLYELLLAFFEDENRKNKTYEKTFLLGNDMVLVRHFPKITTHAIVLATKENHITLTKKEIKKLFGR
jgi:hypothetical protein